MEYSINTKPLLESSDTDDDINDNAYLESENITFNNEKPLFKHNEPVDKYHMAYITFYLLGIVTLLPWNFFITADDYWLYKFRDIHKNSTSGRTPLQASFTSYLSVASSVPNILFLIVNTSLTNRLSLNKRINGSIFLMLVLFIITTVFIQVNTDDWQQQFFILTLAIVILLNSASAILSGSLFGIMSKFSSRFITATVGGQALGGIFAAISQIIALAIGASSVHSAFVYFMVGNVMLFISLVMYIILSKTVFFKYHISNRTGIAQNEFDGELRPRIVNHKEILKKVIHYGIAVCLVFCISLSVYPGVTVLIESENKGNGHTWNDVYFVPVISYLLFSIGDYCGRLLAGIIQRPRKGFTLIVCNIFRVIFIPLLFFCNAQPRSYIPVYFTKDYLYIIIMVLFALSNGYFANLAFLCVPRVVEQHEKEVASSILTVFLGIGLAIGSIISMFIVKLL